MTFHEPDGQYDPDADTGELKAIVDRWSTRKRLLAVVAVLAVIAAIVIGLIFFLRGDTPKLIAHTTGVVALV